MRIEDIFNRIEGHLGKQAFITLSDGTKLNPICYGTEANDYGDIYLVISEGKSKKPLSPGDIADIQFPD